MPALEEDWNQYSPKTFMDTSSLRTATIPSEEARDEHSSPVHLVPDDVLNGIFMLLCRSRDKLAASWHWSLVTHVTRRWRSVALSNPLLWAFIPFDYGGHGWVEECCRRAAHVPLALTQPLQTPSHSARMAAFRDCITSTSHVRSIRIERAHLIIMALNRFLAKPARVLECLHISANDGALPRYTMFLPRRLFASTAPCLRIISLRGCTIQWTTLEAFPSLTKLSLRNDEPGIASSHILIRPHASEDAAQAKWEDMFATLNTLKRLRELTIEYYWPDHVFPASVTFATLPLLEQITLKGHPEQCAYALAHINAPACA
ncbi:unnamed protein product [Peniophora sp. CBMAI 1063]|nr:unnamed protein product [Peniophora sp. CBMAI 1063]